MNQKIVDYLHQIEVDRNIKILLACETGSRAWGFPSPNSDYDIRMIYVHKQSHYISILNHKDSIEMMLDDNEIDISGWELRKTLKLLSKSNAALLERIQSPVQYILDVEFLEDLMPLAQASYSRIATMHHYLSMTRRFLDELSQSESYKLKKFFYALRSSFVCKWILEYDTMPPIEFNKIYPNIGLDDSLVERIQSLIELKSTVNEDYKHSGEEELIKTMYDFSDQAYLVKNNLPTAKVNMKLLDDLFRKYVLKYDH